MKKKPFLLLEILIAFFLVSLCIVPLVRQPLSLYQSELKRLEEMEKERLADWSFTEVKERLLKNEIPWEKIPAKSETSGPFSLPDALIQLPGCASKIIKRTFILTGRGQKPGKDEAEYRQLGIYIYLGKDKYAFRLPVKKVVEK
jgi:hypothetical protein